jgi:tetratricopeptide (TPR) repeat protein
MSSELRNMEDLHKIQTRLEGIFGLTKQMAHQMGEIQTQMHSMDSKVDEIKAMMKPVQVHKAALLPWGEMPMKPRSFRGRDVVVADVARLLISGDKAHVCILGPGGMGKTSVALAVMETDAVGKKFTEANRFWVPCVGATSSALFLQILYSSLRITRDTGDALADIRNELRACADPRIILLDNFETPWNPREGNQQDVERILRSLSTIPHTSILVTMRSNFPPSDEIEWEYKNLEPTDENASRIIYTDIDPTAAENPALDDLLRALGHMPFAVTLMATLGKKSKSPPDELLSMWSEGGTDLQEGMNHCIGLSVDSKLVTDNPDALTLLAILSMLPAGTTHRHLDWWAQTLKKKAGAIATLSDAALVIDKDLGESRGVMISILPVVQSYMHQSNRISSTVRKIVQEACFKFVRDHRSKADDPRYKNHSAALASEETNIQAILLEAASQITEIAQPPSHSNPMQETDADVDTLLEVLLIFAWYQCWSIASTEVAERCVAVARTMKKQRHLANALHCLGSNSLQVVRYAEACEHFKEAREHFRDLPDEPDSLGAGNCALDLADAYQYLSKPPNVVEKLVLEAQNDFKKDGSKFGKARGLYGRGRTCWYQGNHNAGLELLDIAREIFEPMERPIDVAFCLYEAAKCHAGEGRYLQAMESIQGALLIFENLSLVRQECESSVLKARYLRMLDRGDDSLGILRRCLEKCQHLGSPRLIAQTLEEFGAVYARKADYRAARAAYEGAQEQFESIPDTCLSQEGGARCQHNIIQLLRVERDPVGCSSIQLQYAIRH